MTTTIAVIGPHDLVELTGDVAAQVSGVRVRSCPYQHESETAQIVGALGSDVDVFLFTGVIPYEIAGSHQLLDRVAEYVEYGGPALLGALVTLLREGRDVSSLSIDTLPEEQVHETLQEAGIPLDSVSVLPYRLGRSSAQFAEFHREAHARDSRTIAVTCVRSVYDDLAPHMPAVRLAPSRSAVREVVTRLRLIQDSRESGDAQVVLGLVEVDDSAETALAAELGALGATLVRTGPHRFLVVATRGPLEEVTSQFTELPMLGRLKTQHATVRMGFGVGGSGAEAHTLARRALARAKTTGRVAAVVSLRNEADFVLSKTAPPRPSQRHNLQQLALRAGLSKQTMQELQDFIRDAADGDITTRDLAAHMDVQPRTARRLLNKLERAGLARAVGTRSPGGSGRPLVTYRVFL